MDIKRLLLMIVTFVLGAVLLVFIYLDAANDRARDTARQEAEIGARQYEIRIQELEVEILEHQKAAEVVQEQGRAVVGFHLSAPEDVAFAVSAGETYGFKPTVVLDCTASDEELLAVAEALQAAGHPADIMLTGFPFDEEVLARARMLLSELPARDFSRGISFLLRNADDSEENRALIYDEAFSGYSFYSENGAAGTLPSGTPYISYSFMRSADTDMGGVLRKISSGRTSMIVVLDLDSVAQGTLNQETIWVWLDRIREENDSGRLEICSVDDAFGALRQLRAQNDAAAAEYESFKAEKESEIEALREKIAEIKK